MHISDGYNRFAELLVGKEVLRLEYRPALKRERFELFNRMVMLGDEASARNLLEIEIHSRVFATNFDLSRIVSPENPRLFDAAVKCVLGQAPRIDEEQDARNLREGVRLYLQYPALSRLSCGTCQKWLMDPLSGRIWDRNGKPIPRSLEDALLCQTPEGCPKGTPDAPKSLSPKNEQALRHYLECQAVGHFPDDAIVKRNARIIREVYTQHEASRARK